VCILIFPSIILTGCKVPDAGRLKSRVQTLYQAESSHDWNTFYQILAPQVKADTTYKQFLEERDMWPAYNKVEWSIMTIESFIDPNAKNYRSAKVSMDATYILVDGRREHSKDQTDYWIYIEGEWYWFYRGFPAD
jgi:hypothetical protein